MTKAELAAIKARVNRYRPVVGRPMNTIEMIANDAIKLIAEIERLTAERHADEA